MIRRMADKFGTLASPKQNSSSARYPESVSSASSSASVSMKSSSMGDVRRGSMSTARTSVSEGAGLHKGAMDVDVIQTIPEGAVPVLAPRVVRRPKGAYRLSDFIIQRTLGTGSFGRVHLGKCVSLLPNRVADRAQCAASTICDSMR